MTGATIPEGSVVITPTEMYREMLATHQAVRDVSGKLDGALDAHARRLDGIDKDVADHEARLRPLSDASQKISALDQRLVTIEQRMWKAIGGFTVVSGGLGALASYLASKH